MNLNTKIKEFIEVTKGDLILGNPHNIINRLSIDSRTLLNRDFFLTIKGENFDGFDFIPDALSKGAQGIITSRLVKTFGHIINPPILILVHDTINALKEFSSYHRRKFNPTVIAITGSNGKTTTKEMLGNILTQNNLVVVNKESYNNHIGVPLTLLEIESFHKYVVLEIGANHFGEIEELSGVAKPKIVVITNIGEAHLEFFNDREGVFKAKTEIINSLDKDGVLFINGDDEYLLRLKNIFPPERLITFGLKPDNNIYAKDITYFPKLQFIVTDGIKEIKINLSINGNFNIYNAVASVSVALYLGIDEKTIESALYNFITVPGRYSIKVLNNDTILVNDAYNSNPTSLKESVISFANQFLNKNKIVVIGDMLELGDKSKPKHIELGEYLATLPLDKFYLTGEYANFIAEGLKNKFIDENKIFVLNDREKLFDKLKDELKPTNAIFFKASNKMRFYEICEKLYSLE